MSKKLIITEKPSVGRDFAKALNATVRHDGYIEGDEYVVTWCVGHLVMMSYPEKYDPKYNEWDLDTLPFIPKTYKYEVIDSSKDQYAVVAAQMKRDDIDTIYYSGDSAREGEYIQRLVRQMVRPSGKKELRVWIDSQTKDEILRGVREAKPLSDYDSLSDAGYMRATEDYLYGINLSRAYSVKYGNIYNRMANTSKYEAIAVGRVMTCVLGMVVDRERLIKSTKTIPFFGISAMIGDVKAAWRSSSESEYFESPKLFKEDAFSDRKDAEALTDKMNGIGKAVLIKRTVTEETNNPPMLYNLAELQSEASSKMKLSPEDTLNIVQRLYEKKMVTYPRTDARVLSTAIAKELGNNLAGLKKHPKLSDHAEEAYDAYSANSLIKSKYVNDAMILDHYAIIPTGQAIDEYDSLSSEEQEIYDMICKRLLAIFMPPARYTKIKNEYRCGNELFEASVKALADPGYLELYDKKDDNAKTAQTLMAQKENETYDASFEVTEGKTSPPKRYTSGSMILAMENAGQLIEDEELRETIKSTGIGTSATRADVISKLIKRGYIESNPKTQVLTPGKRGEIIYDIVKTITPSLLRPEMTANWEKGLAQVEHGEITKENYYEKLCGYVTREVMAVKNAGPDALTGIVPDDMTQNNGKRDFKSMPLPKFKNKAPDTFPKNCPYCKNPMREFDWGTTCPRCGVKVPKTYAEVELSEEERAQLLYKGGTDNEITGLVKKDKSGTYNARLKVFDGWSIRPDFERKGSRKYGH